MSTISTQTLTEILSKPSRNRLDFEIRSVCAWLREKVKYFKKLSDGILQTLVIECTVEKILPKKVVIWEGEVGDCMYILLSGKLSVYRLAEADNDNTSDDHAINLFVDRIRSKPFIDDLNILGQHLATLGSGNIFGEIALIEKCTRTASVVSTEECEIVVIPRQLYDNTVAPVLEEEFKMKSQFIQSVSYFASCSQRHKKQLLIAIESYSCDYPNQIMRQGETVTGMHFLIRGEIRLSCDPQHHLHQFEKSVKAWNLESKTIKTESFTNQGSQKVKKPFNSPKSLDICLLNQSTPNFGDKPCIGDIELLLGLPTSQFSATATSHCVILVLQERHFDRILVKKNPESISMMLEMARNRIEHWSARLGNVIPLLPILKDRILYILRNIHGYKAPATFNQLITKTVDNGYQYSPPMKGAIIDLYGPGTAFYYIRNQYKLREKNRKHNQDRKSRKHIMERDRRILNPNTSHLQRPNEKVNNRVETFSKEVGYGTYYDNHTKELEDRIATFLKKFNSTKSIVVEPLSDILEKLPKMKYPKRGNLVILKPVDKPPKYLEDTNLSAEESIKMYLEQKKTE